MRLLYLSLSDHKHLSYHVHSHIAPSDVSNSFPLPTADPRLEAPHAPQKPGPSEREQPLASFKMSANNNTQRLNQSAQRLRQVNSHLEMAADGVTSAFGAVQQAPEDPLGKSYHDLAH